MSSEPDPTPVVDESYWEGWSNEGKRKMIISLARTVIAVAEEVEAIPTSLLEMQWRVWAGLGAIQSAERGEMV